jgi:hypothetical protein
MLMLSIRRRRLSAVRCNATLDARRCLLTAVWWVGNSSEDMTSLVSHYQLIHRQDCASWTTRADEKTRRIGVGSEAHSGHPRPLFSTLAAHSE